MQRDVLKHQMADGQIGLRRFMDAIHQECTASIRQARERSRAHVHSAHCSAMLHETTYAVTESDTDLRHLQAAAMLNSEIVMLDHVVKHCPTKHV